MTDAQYFEEQKQHKFRNKQWLEAYKRMKRLNMSAQCIQAFKEDKVWESEGVGALYELNPDEQKIVDEFEKKYGALVYHMIHNQFEFGECYTILYVSKYEEEWQEDLEDVSNGYAMSYVKNIDAPECSEFGTVAIKPNIGGLVRVS